MMKNIVNWLTVKLMTFQLEKAKESCEKEQDRIIKSAKKSMVKCFEDTIIFLDAINQPKG